MSFRMCPASIYIELAGGETLSLKSRGGKTLSLGGGGPHGTSSSTPEPYRTIHALNETKGVLDVQCICTILNNTQYSCPWTILNNTPPLCKYSMFNHLPEFWTVMSAASLHVCPVYVKKSLNILLTISVTIIHE